MYNNSNVNSEIARFAVTVFIVATFVGLAVIAAAEAGLVAAIAYQIHAITALLG